MTVYKESVRIDSKLIY